MPETKQAESLLGRLQLAATVARNGPKKISKEELREVLSVIEEAVVRSDLPVDELAPRLEEIPAQIYAEALLKFWAVTSETRRSELLALIASRPRKDFILMVATLVPALASASPKQARSLVPTDPGLETTASISRLARSWLSTTGELVSQLLDGEAAEYEVTRVLRAFLRLACESAVAEDVKSDVFKRCANAVSGHALADVKTGMAEVVDGFKALRGVMSDQGQSESASWLVGNHPLFAARLGLNVANPDLTPSQPTPQREASIAGGGSSEATPPVRKRRSELSAAILAKALEHRQTFELLQAAAQEIEASHCQLEELRKSMAADLDTAGREVERLHKQLSGADAKLSQSREELAGAKNKLTASERRVQELESRLAAALAEKSAQVQELTERLDRTREGVAAAKRQEFDEFKGDLGRRISEVLRGTPDPDQHEKIPSRAALIRLWELVDVLRRKSITVSVDGGVTG